MSTTLLLLLGAGALLLAMGRKNRRAEQIGRIKRRIYKEVSLAQSAGVDFSKKYDDLTEDEIVVLESVGSDAGWKQSKRSIEAGKSYAESYYGSLRRAWNAVSGVQGIGKAYNVKDADGNLVLTWIEDAAAHVAREREVEEMEKRIRKTRNAMKRRQREIDRRGTLAVQPTPAEVKVEESAEVIEQPKEEPVAPPTPKKKRVSKANKSEERAAEREERAVFADNFLDEWAQKNEAIKNALNNIRNKKDGKTYGEMILKAFVDGTLAVKDNANGEFVRLVDYADDDHKNGWFNLSNSAYRVASMLLNAWKEHQLETPELDNIRRALLNKAKHMDVYIDTQGTKTVIAPALYEGGNPVKYNVPNIITARGDDREKYLNNINYIVVATSDADMYGRGTRVYYPVRAFKDKWDAETFSKNRKGKSKVLQITDIDIDAISGVSGWQDIAEFENVIYDAVQEYLDNPDGYEHATLHIYLDKNEMKYRAEMEDNLQGTEDDGIYPIEDLIRDGEPDIDAISDIANSWVFLD